MQYEGHSMHIVEGYYDVYFPEHPNARKDGYVMLHIIVASKLLGRPLRKGEVVHHKDRNRLNNDEDNLMVFASTSDHTNYHAYVLGNCTFDFVLYRSNNVYRCQSAEVFFNQTMSKNKNGKYLKPCPMCGKLIRLQSKSCPQCCSKSQRKVERPTRYQLKTHIRNTPFTTIAQNYGVTDNAVRKWCKQYGLPYRAAEIRKISSDDWQRI